MTNFAEQLDLVEQQIHTLNESQALYPVKEEKIKVRLSDTKMHYYYDTTDTWLDNMLDSIILHQSLIDDYIIQVSLGDEKLFETYITRECFDKIKKILDAE